MSLPPNLPPPPSHEELKNRIGYAECSRVLGDKKAAAVFNAADRVFKALDHAFQNAQSYFIGMLGRFSPELESRLLTTAEKEEQPKIEQEVKKLGEIQGKIDALNGQQNNLENLLELRQTWLNKKAEIDTYRENLGRLKYAKEFRPFDQAAKKIDRLFRANFTGLVHSDTQRFETLKGKIEANFRKLEDCSFLNENEPESILSEIENARNDLKVLSNLALASGNKELASDIDNYYRAIDPKKINLVPVWISKLDKMSREIAAADQGSSNQKDLETKKSRLLEKLIAMAASEYTYHTASDLSPAISQEKLGQLDSRILTLTTALRFAGESLQEGSKLQSQLEPLFDCLNKKSEALRGLSEEGAVSMDVDIAELEQVVLFIEEEALHQLEMKALMDENYAKLKQQNQIKEILEDALLKGRKVGVEGGVLKLAKRGISLPLVTSKQKTKALETITFILDAVSKTNKIDTKKSNGGQLKGTTQQIRATNKRILELLEDKRSWTSLGLSKQGAAELKSRIQELKAPSAETVDAVKLSPPWDRLLALPVNPSFQRQFLLSYRWIFKSSDELFKSLTEQFNSPHTPLYQRQQLLLIVKQWLSDPMIHNDDHIGTEGNPVKEKIKGLINAAKFLPSFTLKRIAEELASMVDASEKAPSTKAPNGTSPVDFLEQIAEGKTTLKSNKTISYEDAVTQFANDMRARSAHQFMQIRSSEFTRQVWAKEDKKQIDAPNITGITENFNKISGAIVNKVLDQDTPEKRAKLIEFFIDVQEALLTGSPFDISSLQAIAASLSSTPISRLHKTWKKVDDKHKAIQKQTLELLAPESSFKNVRQKMEEMKEEKSPYIPFIAIYLKDLTSIDEGNSSEIGQEGSQVFNSDKIGLLGRSINEYLHAQKAMKPFLESQRPTFDLDNLFVQELNDTEAYKISLEREPRDLQDPQKEEDLAKWEEALAKINQEYFRVRNDIHIDEMSKAKARSKWINGGSLYLATWDKLPADLKEKGKTILEEKILKKWLEEIVWIYEDYFSKKGGEEEKEEAGNTCIQRASPFLDAWSEIPESLKKKIPAAGTITTKLGVLDILKKNREKSG